MAPKQIDCFKVNMIHWKFLAIWPSSNFSRYYRYYTIIFVTFFIIVYNMCLSINFYFLPRRLDVFIEELIFYFTELNIMTKVLGFLYMRDTIKLIMDTLESENFQPEARDALKIIQNAKSIIATYWKISAAICYTSNLTHVLTPLFAHIFLPVELALPICSYNFIPENIKDMLVYPLYFYQSIGMHFHMLYTVYIDGFLIGLMILSIAQLEVLDFNLRRLTDFSEMVTDRRGDSSKREHIFKLKLDKCIIHFDQISKFCSLIENVFNVPLFVQFSMSSCIICVSLFRFTLPAPSSYYIFLVTYMAAMILQILVPCWFGSRIVETSSRLSVAAYNCEWTARSRQFKSNLRLFVVRMNKPLSLTGMKMFPLSLTTFTSIMNTAYSFFTLLRHMQAQEH